MSSRREFLTAAAAGLATHTTPQLVTPAPADAWNAGSVRHLIATTNHERIRLKVSLLRPVRAPPMLRVGPYLHRGQRTDVLGEHWTFDVSGLDADRRYDLQLLSVNRVPLCDPWPLSTFPGPDTRPRRCRLLVYTCAGGHDATQDPSTGGPMWVPLAQRRRLLEAGLATGPDAVIAIGDHVYWDLRAGRAAELLGNSPTAQRLVGSFDRTAPVLGTANEAKLHRAVRPQIADLYGTLLRSTPAFFLQDDHDYFENDEARETIVTFPPDDFMLQLARATQAMYYPEFLPDRHRPWGLPGSSAPDRSAGVSEAFGTLRYGKLLEVLLYDCRRFLTLKGPSAGFVPKPAEQWLLDRMAVSDARHVVNLPSTPIGWSAGKWGEWYPDVLQPDGRLGTKHSKYLWPTGWRAQHDRLLGAAHAMPRIPLFLSGDLHALAEGRVVRNGRMNFRSNPVISVLSGPLSTGPLGWPSAFRGTPAQVPTQLDVEEGLSPLERNGFSVVDVTEDAIEMQFYSWKMGEPVSDLDALRPFHRVRYLPPG